MQTSGHRSSTQRRVFTTFARQEVLKKHKKSLPSYKVWRIHNFGVFVYCVQFLNWWKNVISCCITRRVITWNRWQKRRNQWQYFIKCPVYRFTEGVVNLTCASTRALPSTTSTTVVLAKLFPVRDSTTHNDPCSPNYMYTHTRALQMHTRVHSRVTRCNAYTTLLSLLLCSVPKWIEKS